MRVPWQMLLLGGLLLASSGASAVTAPRRRRARTPQGPQVPAVRGPWSQIRDRAERLRRYARDLLEAYRATGLPELALPLAVAHSMFATAAWAPESKNPPKVWNNNIGVIRAGPSWTGPWAALATVEVTDDRGTIDPSDDVRELQRGQAWRAYATLSDGAAAVVRLWQSSRYRPAYELLLQGDPAWSRVLGEHGYYSANPQYFEQGYRDRLQRVRALLAQGS